MIKLTIFLEKSFKHIVYDQPAAMRDTRDWISKKMSKVIDFFEDIETIYLVGCGDSYFVAIYGALLLERFTKIKAEVYESYEFLRYKYNLDEKAALIAISASGRTSKTIDAAKKAKNMKLKLIALTNYENSPLANLADLKLITKVRDPYGPPSATSTAAMYMLGIIFRTLGNRDYSNNETESLPDTAEKFIRGIKLKIKSYSELLRNRSRIYLVGAGPGYVASLFGGAKFREAAWMHSIVFEAEEFSHYGMISLDKNDLVILNIFIGESFDKLREISSALNQIGVSQLILTNKPEIDWGGSIIELPKINEYDNSIISTIFHQLLAIETARAKKLPVNGFRYTDILTKLIGYYK